MELRSSNYDETIMAKDNMKMKTKINKKFWDGMWFFSFASYGSVHAPETLVDENCAHLSGR